MLPVQSLLNPSLPGSSAAQHHMSPSLSPTWTSVTEQSLADYRPTSGDSQDPRAAAGLARSHIKGEVRFPPFEHNLDQEALAQLIGFQVQPLGRIGDLPRHIPYNSGKKDFFQKTGRESFEVFQYSFMVTGVDKTFTVMWDYNVGLVRMTPFFKACSYNKATKMLNLNRGLKEITHSITGGSIPAQGYWMPYGCAKAVCATFCFNIAGALIPIFGPDFPSICTHPQAPDFATMVINHEITLTARQEAEALRQQNLAERQLYARPGDIGESRSVSPYGRQYHDRSRRYIDPSLSNQGSEYRAARGRDVTPHYVNDLAYRYPAGYRASPRSAPYNGRPLPPRMPTSHPWTPPDCDNILQTFDDDDPFKNSDPWMASIPPPGAPFYRSFRAPPTPPQQLHSSPMAGHASATSVFSIEDVPRQYTVAPGGVIPTVETPDSAMLSPVGSPMVEKGTKHTDADEDAAALLLTLGVVQTRPDNSVLAPASRKPGNVTSDKAKATDRTQLRRSKRTKSA